MRTSTWTRARYDLKVGFRSPMRWTIVRASSAVAGLSPDMLSRASRP